MHVMLQARRGRTNFHLHATLAAYQSPILSTQIEQRWVCARQSCCWLPTTVWRAI